MELWRDIPGYIGFYQASCHGRVRSLDRTLIDGRQWKGRVLRPGGSKTGHLTVTLHRDEKQSTRLVHHLVLQAFVGPRPAGLNGLHNDGDPTNNYLENLRWGTQGENLLDAVAHGTHYSASKTHCPRGHELQAPNLVPSQLRNGRRQCLACNRAQSRMKYHPEIRPQIQQVADSYYRALGFEDHV